MMRVVLAWLLLLLPVVAGAQSYPALYDVTGVSAEDTLNVREGPSTDFRIVDKLQPGETGLEVVDASDDGEWGLVNVGERAGWVSLRFMSRQPGQPATGVPRRLTCSGTEPFWSFFLTPDRKAGFMRQDAEVAFENVLTVTSENRPDRHALFADGGDVVVTAMVGRNQCSDGMSDRVYGLGIDLLVTDKAAVRVYSGCCSVSP